MRTLSPEKDESRGVNAAGRVDQRMCGEKAACQAAAETNRGGGERGSMESGKSIGFVNSIGELMAATGAVVTDGGNTKAIELNRERSESWQQEMEQVIIAGMSWPQSM